MCVCGVGWVDRCGRVLLTTIPKTMAGMRQRNPGRYSKTVDISKVTMLKMRVHSGKHFVELGCVTTAAGCITTAVGCITTAAGWVWG